MGPFGPVYEHVKQAMARGATLSARKLFVGELSASIIAAGKPLSQKMTQLT
jgi:hypothetical protein